MKFKFRTLFLAIAIFMVSGVLLTSYASNGGESASADMPLEECDIFTVTFDVRTSLQSDSIPLIVGNKSWSGGKITDLMSTSNMGIVRSTGRDIGWSIFVQQSGAWGWNIGDGKGRLDYLPSVEKQRVNDGKWHKIGMSYSKEMGAVYLSFDGKLRAIYSVTDLKISATTFSGADALTKGCDNIKIRSLSAGECEMCSDDFSQEWMSKGHISASEFQSITPENLTVMSWNIWHGGRHNGVELGVEQTITAIKESGADVVCMQETYGSGPFISDALGTILYHRGSNLSVHTRYPIVDTYHLYDSFRLGGVRVKAGEQLMDIFSLWIHYLPSIDALYPTESAELILEEENKTRGGEIRDIISKIESCDRAVGTGETPLIIAGDFNSMSHLDWTEETRVIHNNYVIEWPVSKAMVEFGMTDSFRSLCPNSLTKPGITWSPRFRESLRQRIDYIYTKGGLECIDSYVKGYNDMRWPSDHAAVVSKFIWK